jgi:hypothetical protein
MKKPPLEGGFFVGDGLDFVVRSTAIIPAESALNSQNNATYGAANS